MSTRKKARRPSLKGSLNPSKRHRDRVNVELDNLAKLLPFAPEVIAKLDKLSVLRLSASYLRTKNFFKGLNVSSEGKSTDLSVLDDFEKTGAISELLLEALDGFLMVLTQDGEVFYASDSISDFLGVSQASVIHQDFLRFVHVDDQQMLENNLKLVPSPPEQKIREIIDDDDCQSPAETSDNGKEVNKERSFVCRFKCVLNTNAGFFKPFKCHGRLREVDVPDESCPNLALFLVCSPLEMTTSIIEVRMKSMLFSTKNKLDLTFLDIDQKGKQIVGYTKKDISTQSSYCMMHYDDIPVLKAMHESLMTTGKCKGVFRWLNKQQKWQWLSGTGEVIFKNNRPDFVITTNNPLTDEEGEEEVRRRERELGMVPTSPASLLSHLQIAGSPSNSSSRVGSPDDLLPPQMLQYAPGPPNVSPSLVSPNVSTTSCTSDPFPPEDLPLDLAAADFLFEASDTSRASLSDLDSIVKGDLVSDLFDLDVNDMPLDPLSDSNTVPLTHASDSSYSSSEISPNLPVSQPDTWMPRDQGMTSQYVRGQPQAVSSYNSYGTPRISSTGTVPPSGVGSTGIMFPGTVPSQGVRPSQNGIPTNDQFVNVSDPSGYVTMTSSQPLPPPGGNVGSSQAGLLALQAQPMLNRSYVKTEPVRSVGYYCNSTGMDSVLPGVMNGSHFPGGMSAPSKTYRYHDKLSHVGMPQLTTSPPSPYSSGSSSTSSYDALHVQFSPNDIMTSPFASPHDDNDYSHGTGPPYANGGHPRHSFTRPQPTFPQTFVDIPEIAPMGVVEELVPGVHHTSPLASRTPARFAHL